MNGIHFSLPLVFRYHWPNFQWNPKKLAGPLARLRHRQGRLIGRMETLGFSLREEATLQR